LWDSLFGYASALVKEATGGEVTTLFMKDGKDLYALHNGAEVPVEDFGGAKQSIVGLALRIAFSHVFYGQGLPLLLDEVSSDCSDATASMLAGMLRGVGSQIILVSHRTGDTVNADSIVEL
jgi:ABC-type transport system involved in cytochrome bd biosynthesis fused ATPase/permease subunit